MCDTRKRSSNNSSEVNSGVSTDPLGVSCDGEGWWGSNYGAGLDIVAPGVKIYSTDLTGSAGYSATDYNPIFNGTSSATPNAAGVMALILSVNPNLTGTRARQIVESTCDKIGGYNYQANVSGQPNGTWCADVGYGRVNALKAVISSLNLSISGPSQICDQGTYTIDNLPAGATVVWSNSSLLRYISGQGTNSYTVRGISQGNATLTATLTMPSGNTIPITYPIWIGKPSTPTSIEGFVNGQVLVGNGVYNFSVDNPPLENNTQFNWIIRGGTITNEQNTPYIEVLTNKGKTDTYFDIKVNAQNACGCSDNLWLIGSIKPNGGPIVIDAYPNPTSSQVEVNLVNYVALSTIAASPNVSTTISYAIKIIDSYGILVYSATKKEKKFTIPTTSFRNGVYTVIVSDGTNTYQNKLIVKH